MEESFSVGQSYTDQTEPATNHFTNRWMRFDFQSQDIKTLKPLIEPKTTDLAHLAVKQLSVVKSNKKIFQKAYQRSMYR